jgi:cytochrome c biogenesis protein CcdA
LSLGAQWLFELLLAYLAGLLTLLNPCVLPVLPIVLAASLQADRRGPLALAAGLSVSFVSVGLFVIVLGAAFGIGQQSMTMFGAWLMVTFGAILLVPRLNEGFAFATSGFSARADARMQAFEAARSRAGLGSQFLGGALLGAVWSPCIGPTLGGAISLASQGQEIAWSGAIMTSFAFGVSTIILALAFGAREVIVRRQNLLRRLSQKAKPVLGLTFLGVGLAILFGLDHWLEEHLLNLLPVWFQDLSVSI